VSLEGLATVSIAASALSSTSAEVPGVISPFTESGIAASMPPLVSFLANDEALLASDGTLAHPRDLGRESEISLVELGVQVAGPQHAGDAVSDVARVALLYDILKAEGLSPRASIELARKAIEQWT
jgi:hypothetical protein